ncbi:MAG: bifunctional hydroxymethylpyrimidine kinase/phosphomethylpyrimidine kinase [Chloroflexi bacterium]|nr:bifunctional hydroxymethylpyrimidine kinase/phosphomethylpyrimidine kinase [Chloroflexota bacterium]
MRKALTIAGSDSGGGAGIQADLKTFSALGVFGMSAITAITAQNTVAVTDVVEIPPATIGAQIDAVVTDIGVDAVKLGMLSSAPIIEVVGQKIREHRLDRIVIDPVMIAKSGAVLLREDAIAALREILPLALVVTPNLPEAAAIIGEEIEGVDDMRRAAKAIIALGARGVVVKGGHLDGPATDIYYDGREFREYTAERIATTSTHGTGCTFASAIAAWLARGADVPDAVGRAKEYLHGALKAAVPIGHGHGPVHHFYQLWPESREQD